jgi:hypothetical protein
MNRSSFQLNARRASAAQLCDAIANCYPEDVAQILSAVLEDLETDGPILSLDDLRTDAKFWADCASPRELETYLWAILRVLGERAFGQRARKRLIVSLWGSLAFEDRAAFLARVDADHKFVRRAA